MELVRHLPFADYRKRTGVNGSLLKIVDELSLQHAKAAIDGADAEKSEAMDFGTSFHALLLEGRVDYAIIPETYENKGETKPWNWNANACKEWSKEQGGKSLYTQAEAKRLEEMVAAVSDHPELKPLLKGDSELSVFAEKDGIPVKSRIDLLPADPSAPVIDFKTTRCAEPGQFLKHAISLRYHMGGAWNLDVLRWAGVKRNEFWLVAIEDRAPFAICILKFRDTELSFLRVGRRKCRAAFEKLKQAHQSGYWPGYGSHAAEVHAPAWMLPELEQTAA